MAHRRTAVMLLKSGPLTVAQFHEITGWKYPLCSRILRELLLDGMIRSPKRGVYEA